MWGVALCCLVAAQVPTSSAAETPAIDTQTNSKPRFGSQALFRELETMTSTPTADIPPAGPGAASDAPPGSTPRPVVAPGSAPRSTMPPAPAVGPPGRPPTRAEPPAAPTRTEPSRRSTLAPTAQGSAQTNPKIRQWYGWQTLLVSVPGAITAFVGILVRNTPLAYAGIMAHVFGPGAVHFAHDRPGLGIASVAIHAGAGPTFSFGGFYASLLFCGAECDNRSPYTLVGLGVGALVGIFVDSFLLAYTEGSNTGADVNFAATFDGDTAQASIGMRF